MPKSRLYAILDADACARRGLPTLAVGEALCEAAPALLQFRAKHRSVREVMDVLPSLRAWTHARGTLLFMNDRADLAALAGCDGVHVGQGDQSVASVRQHFPRLRVGVSTHSEIELDRALALGPDYVALGPVFPTGSKEACEPAVGLDELARLGPRARALGVPLVAIGGIDAARLAAVLEHADYVATIAALLPDPSSETDAGFLLRAVRDRVRAYEAAPR